MTKAIMTKVDPGRRSVATATRPVVGRRRFAGTGRARTVIGPDPAGDHPHPRVGADRAGARRAHRPSAGSTPGALVHRSVPAGPRAGLVALRRPAAGPTPRDTPQMTWSSVQCQPATPGP